MSLKLLIIDNDAEYRMWIRHHITSEWPEAQIVEHDPVNGRMLPRGFNLAACDVVLLDQKPDGYSGIEWLRDFKRRPSFPPILMLTAEGDEEFALQSIKAGAEDYIPKQKVSHNFLAQAVRNAVRSGRQKNARLRREKASPKQDDKGLPVIKGHRLIKHLTTGGVSSVYLMENEQTARPVVIKMLRQVPDQSSGKSAFDRFLQEYEVISGLHHPNIVEISDLGIGDDHAYIVMEYFPAGDLRSRIRAGIDPQRALSYLEQMAEALQAIHSVGVLHRDLKPGNVMLREDDSLALIDFGLAKRLQMPTEITNTGEIFGTPYYMSPEQGHGDEVDERGDIYGLGVIFFEMLTGRKPYVAASPMAVIFKHSHAPVPKLTGQEAVYQPLLDRMMAKEPQDRFQSAEQLLEAVRNIRNITP